ncbi:hypothetical protein [Paenibacillus sp. PCH8]|uniref:hypothetical protein n=1 Tax=Paenibacillus sp. PCH8 TaxID=2066524 RepID=UPI0015E3647C|nr:hypothetical protein [Paenibacillus sp. PCH8]
MNREYQQMSENDNIASRIMMSHQNGKITHYKDYWNLRVVLGSDSGGNEDDQQ